VAGQAEPADPAWRGGLTAHTPPALHIDSASIAQSVTEPPDDGRHARIVCAQRVGAREEVLGQLAEHASMGEDAGQDHLDPLLSDLGCQAGDVGRHVGLRALATHSDVSVTSYEVGVMPAVATHTGVCGVPAHDDLAGMAQDEAEDPSWHRCNATTGAVDAAMLFDEEGVAASTQGPALIVHPCHLGDDTASTTRTLVPVGVTRGAQRLAADPAHGFGGSTAAVADGQGDVGGTQVT
jgi:hypothetical protein